MGLVTLGTALALLEELYTAILPSDMARDQLTQTLTLTTDPTAMEDMPMDPPMATDTGVDIPMFPGHLLLDMDVNAARPTERPMMKLRVVQVVPSTNCRYGSYTKSVNNCYAN